MPETKPAGGFNVVPAAKPLSPVDMKKVFDTQMGKAAVALGGTLITPDEPVKQKKLEYTFPVADEDKKAYIRSLLGKERFQKGYEAFGGKLIVTFQTRTVKDVDTLKRMPDDTRLASKMAMSIIRLSVGVEEREPYSLDDIAYSAVCKLFNDFEELCDEMYRRANDPDFWTGTGGRA